MQVKARKTAFQLVHRNDSAERQDLATPEEEAGQFMINILKEASNLYSIPPETASEYAWAPLKGQDLVKPNKDITNFLRYSPLKRNG
jgi:hypothetical protein